jgi:hypothetical protein
VVKVCQQAGVRYSITARCNKGVRKAIQQIPDDAWVPISYWLEGRGPWRWRWQFALVGLRCIAHPT